MHICLCFLFASDIKIIWRIKGKDLNRNDDLKTYLVACICVGAAALTSCQSPVCVIFPRPRTFLQDRALSFWLLLKNSRTEMPNKIGKLCFGLTPTSLFGSKQKCEVKETSLFPAKWTSVHLNTRSAHLGFDPSHFLCDPSRLPVRLSVSTQNLEKSFTFSWHGTPLYTGNISAKLPDHSSKVLFSTKLTRGDNHTSPWTCSKCSLSSTHIKRFSALPERNNDFPAHTYTAPELLSGMVSLLYQLQKDFLEQATDQGCERPLSWLFPGGPMGQRHGFIAAVYYQSQQQGSVSPRLALLGKGPAAHPQSVLLPSPGRCRVPFLHSHSSELLYRPAVHSGNVNSFFCTNFFSISHPYLVKKKGVCKMQTSPLAPHCQDQLDTTRWGWRTCLGTSQSPQMAAADKFHILIVLCPRTERPPA